MQLLYKRLFVSLTAFMFFIVSGLLATTPARAQDDGVLISITGKLEAVNADGTIVIDGATYKLGQGVAMPSAVQIGTVIVVTGQFNNNTDIVIITITTGNTIATAT